MGVVQEELLEGFTIVKLFMVSRFQIRNALEKASADIVTSEDLIVTS